MELQRHETGEQYEQQREHEEATLQVDFPDDIPSKSRYSIKYFYFCSYFFQIFFISRTWDDLRSQLAPEFLNIIKEAYPNPNPLQVRLVLFFS